MIAYYRKAQCKGWPGGAGSVKREMHRAGSTKRFAGTQLVTTTPPPTHRPNSHGGPFHLASTLPSRHAVRRLRAGTQLRANIIGRPPRQ
jgi:hypothetical protein